MRFGYGILEWAVENEMETEVFVLSILSFILVLIVAIFYVNEDDSK